MNKKLKIYAVAGITLAAVAGSIFYKPKDVVKEIERPNFDGYEQNHELLAEVDGKEYNVNLNILPKQIPKEQLEEYFDEAYEIVLENILGKNTSLENVRDDLNFVRSIEKYGMDVEYYLDDYDVVDCFGTVSNLGVSSEGEKFILGITIIYGDQSKTYEKEIKVFPPEETGMEQEQKIIEQELMAINQDGVTDDKITLPEQIDGKEVSFFQKGTNPFNWILVVIILAGAFYYYKNFYVVKKKQEKKEIQMKMDYSEIVSKLTLLMGSGMSGAKAFLKISDDYSLEFENKKIEKRYAYEEMKEASNRLRNGISEEEVYSDFGRKCHIHGYIKLSGLLIQNVKKGSSGFVDILRGEAEDAFIERKNMARKCGEEAGTKLLFPMSLMLGIVLVIIIVPAFMSF